MANPQKENGYTAIANEIVDRLARLPLSNYETRVLWAVFRKTYGWQRKADHISYGQFIEITGIHDARNIYKALKALQNRRMIIISKNGSNIRTYAFQKDFDKWETMSVETSSVETSSVETSSVNAKTMSVGTCQTMSVGTYPPMSVQTTTKESIKESVKATTTKTRELGETDVVVGSEILIELYKKNFKEILPSNAEKLTSMVHDYSFPVMKYALEEAIKKENRKISYIEGIAKNVVADKQWEKEREQG